MAAWDPGEEIVVGELPPGITLASAAVGNRTWSVLGHTYQAKSISTSSFAFLALDPPGTGVPPHVHTTQDEHLFILEGIYTLYLDGEWQTAGPGDTVRLPKGLPHALYNRSDDPATSLVWVSPAGRLAQLFDRLHELEDIQEAVRISAEHDVEFLPPGSVEGA